MGRRSLPKVDKQVDLTHNFRTSEELPDAWSAQELFLRKAPLEIEVGTGKGLFLQRASEVFPDHDFLGIEVARKYARFAASRLAKKERRNAVVISGDALKLFAEWIPPQAAVAVHVYFPDPWWKKRHHKRRVMNEAFLRNVERVLRSGGRLHFWTDVEEYYRPSLELIHEATKLDGPHPVDEEAADHTLDYRTHFERRTRLAGLPVYRCEFIKP
ncbi:MAG: tRNA (guanosine(46)-N7)-methyltransferase TrmB [Planctomycetales bacterium]|nr:tRNA (guanosine(46)-N7)-methyltransferase TrmB [Planctomycetales bacterium]